jgi:hypothetical protein
VLSSKQCISSVETRAAVNVMRQVRREAGNAARSRERRQHDRHYGLLNRNAQRLQREKKGRPLTELRGRGFLLHAPTGKLRSRSFLLRHRSSGLDA